MDKTMCNIYRKWTHIFFNMKYIPFIRDFSIASLHQAITRASVDLLSVRSFVSILNGIMIGNTQDISL